MEGYFMQQMLAPKEIAEATVGVGKYKTSNKNSIVFVSAMLDYSLDLATQDI
ncbi:hypothetical protein [Turicibacter sanguinis]|uniref:hypothetical protein n=1 Tax=Turicibacter sanguinis TaxID=154288 RepID=UPI00399B943C